TSQVFWSPNGRDLLVETVQGQTTRRLTLDPETFEPRGVELSRDGHRAAYSVLSRSVDVVVRDDSFAHPRIPSRIEIRVPETGVALTMTLINPENVGASKLREKSFDLESLKRAYSVDRVVSLDEAGTP